MNEIIRGTKKMSKFRQIRQRCDERHKKIMCNSLNICEDCNEVNRSSFNVRSNDLNQDDVDSM